MSDVFATPTTYKRTTDVRHDADANTFNFYVNGGHWQIAVGSDLVFVYDPIGKLTATYVTSEPIDTLDDFDHVVNKMMDAGVGL